MKALSAVFYYLFSFCILLLGYAGLDLSQHSEILWVNNAIIASPFSLIIAWICIAFD